MLLPALSQDVLYPWFLDVYLSFRILNNILGLNQLDTKPDNTLLQFQQMQTLPSRGANSENEVSAYVSKLRIEDPQLTVKQLLDESQFRVRGGLTDFGGNEYGDFVDHFDVKRGDALPTDRIDLSKPATIENLRRLNDAVEKATKLFDETWHSRGPLAHCLFAETVNKAISVFVHEYGDQGFQHRYGAADSIEWNANRAIFEVATPVEYLWKEEEEEEPQEKPQDNSFPQSIRRLESSNSGDLFKEVLKAWKANDCGFCPWYRWVQWCPWPWCS